MHSISPNQTTLTIYEVVQVPQAHLAQSGPPPDPLQHLPPSPLPSIFDAIFQNPFGLLASYHYEPRVSPPWQNPGKHETRSCYRAGSGLLARFDETFRRMSTFRVGLCELRGAGPAIFRMGRTEMVRWRGDQWMEDGHAACEVV